MKWIGPSSGSFLSPSTYVSMTVIKRNRGEEKWRGGSREKIKGKEKGSRRLTNHMMGCRRVLRSFDTKQGSWSPLAFLPTIPKWFPRMDGNKFLSKKRLGSLPLDSGDTVAPLAVDCSG